MFGTPSAGKCMTCLSPSGSLSLILALPCISDDAMLSAVILVRKPWHEVIGRHKVQADTLNDDAFGNFGGQNAASAVDVKLALAPSKGGEQGDVF